MARADYDYNIWSDRNGILRLTAYEQYYDADDDMWIRTNTEKYHQIAFKFPKDTEEIEYLLQDLYVNQAPLEGYDEWVDNPFLFGNDCPTKIAEFINSLPDYEMPTKRSGDYDDK